MNIYKHELRTNMKITVIWIAALSGITCALLALYPSIKSEVENYIRMINNLPPAMKALLNMDASNLRHILGYYSFLFIYTLLFGAIQAMNLGVGIISGEQRERTADFLLTKPVSRTKILTSKLLGSLTLLIITNIIYSAASLLILNIFSESFEISKFILINLSLIFVQLIFLSIGLIISAAAKKIKSVLTVSLGTVFMFYAISAFAVNSNDDKKRYITPFQYFKTDYILSDGHYEIGFIIIGLVLVTACIALSYILYKNKDIHAV